MTEGPLAGRRIAVTRAAGPSNELSEALARLGAVVVDTPAIRFADPPDWAPLDRALDALDAYDWILWTSRNTLPRVAARMRARGADPADLVRVRGAHVAIGAGTAKDLAAFGLEVRAVPTEMRAEGLVELLAGERLEGLRVLLLRALEGRDVAPEALAARGAVVDVVPVYRTLPDDEGLARARESLVAGRLDAMTFTSASIVRHVVAALGDAAPALSRTVRASIGPVTSAALAEAGFAASVESHDPSSAGLAAALVEHWRGPIVEASEERGSTNE